MLDTEVTDLRSSSSYSGDHVSNFLNYKKRISSEKIINYASLQKAGPQPTLG